MIEISFGDIEDARNLVEQTERELRGKAELAKILARSQPAFAELSENAQLLVANYFAGVNKLANGGSGMKGDQIAAVDYLYCLHLVLREHAAKFLEGENATNNI